MDVEPGVCGMSRFDGRVAIVSGGGSGLGKAVARTLAGEGGLVAIVDISDDAVSRTVGEINDDIERSGSGGTARGFVSDVSDPDRVRATIDAIAADLGRPEILINSAGIGNFANSHEVDPDNWLSIVGVNLNGTFYMCRYALPYLLDGGGNIVNIASNAGLMGQAFSAAYCASKGGVVNLTRALAVEYLKSGVRVNAVAAGRDRHALDHQLRSASGRRSQRHGTNHVAFGSRRCH